MANFKIKRDDTVVVLAGKNKGSTGRVLKVLPVKNRVIVEGVNVIKRHVKAQGDTPGRIVEKEASLHISNVALWNTEEGRCINVANRSARESCGAVCCTGGTLGVLMCCANMV